MPFQGLVQEISQQIMPTLHFTADSIAALQEVTVVYLVVLFEDNNIGAIHTRRFTVMPKDEQHARCMCGE